MVECHELPRVKSTNVMHDLDVSYRFDNGFIMYVPVARWNGVNFLWEWSY